MRKIGLLLSVIFILLIFCSCSNNKIPEQDRKQATQLNKKEVSTTIKSQENPTELADAVGSGNITISFEK